MTTYYKIKFFTVKKRKIIFTFFPQPCLQDWGAKNIDIFYTIKLDELREGNVVHFNGLLQTKRVSL